jgi:chemotaxis protein MotB
MKTGINSTALSVITAVVLWALPVQGDIFYTPSEYNNLYNQKVAVDIELKLLKKQCRNEIDSLESENRKLAGDIQLLKEQIRMMDRQHGEEKRQYEDRIRDLKEQADILKMKSSDREKALLEENDKMQRRYRQEIEKLNARLTDERQSNLKKIAELNDSCNDRISSLNSRIRALDDEIAGLKKLTEAQKEELSRMGRQADDLEKQLGEEIRKGEITIKKFHNRIVINIQDKILFPSGSAALRPEVHRALDKISGVLKDYPENRIQVEGHTDNVPIHTREFRDNWQLSSERALAVLQRLLTNSRLEPGRFSAVGYGEYSPVVPNNSPRNRALNRRVDITVVPMINR